MAIGEKCATRLRLVYRRPLPTFYSTENRPGCCSEHRAVLGFDVTELTRTAKGRRRALSEAAFAHGTESSAFRSHAERRLTAIPNGSGFKRKQPSLSSAFRPHLHIEQLDFPMQVAAFDFEVVGGAGDVPVVLAQLPGNVLLFEGVPRVAERVILFGEQRPG